MAARSQRRPGIIVLQMVEIVVGKSTQIDDSVSLGKSQDHVRFHPIHVEQSLVVAARFHPEVAM